MDRGTYGCVEDGCPLPASHAAFEEAVLHVSFMGLHYHHPRIFLTHLNATIQALRNITWKLQYEEARIPDGKVWYDGEREAMRRDPLLKRFSDARTEVTKRAGVESKSTFRSGLFKGRRMKLAMGLNLPLMMESAEELRRLRGSSFAEFILGDDRSAIGEQLGVERTWVVEALSDSEVLTACVEVVNKLGEVLWRAHARCGSSFRCEPLICDDEDRRDVSVLLETDADPGLSNEWGWDEHVEAVRRLLSERGVG